MLLFQRPEWSEDLQEWKREIHIKCTYDGVQLSETEFPRNWLIEGIQIDPDAYRYKWSNGSKNFQEHLEHFVSEQKSRFQVVFDRSRSEQAYAKREYLLKPRAEHPVERPNLE